MHMSNVFFLKSKFKTKILLFVFQAPLD